MRHKSIPDAQIKDADQGQISAVIATFGVVDHDGDVVEPGAFTDGERVRISAYNHASWHDALPVGRGEIRTTEREAIFDGQFFMANQAARETFEVIKGMGELQEYSWGFDIIEAEAGQLDGADVQFIRKVKTHEVSPVLLGASIGTRTLAVKGKGMKLSDHLDAAIAEVEEITERVADAVAQRAESGQKLAEATLDRAQKLESGIERLREALAIEPRDNDDEAADALVREAARFERLRFNN